MKKSYFSLRHITALVLLVAAFTINSCRKESDSTTLGRNPKLDNNAKFLVGNAKAYLDSALKTNSATIKISSTPGSPEAATFNGHLFWDKAKAFSNSQFEVVEVPLALDYKETNFYKLGGDTSAYVTDKAVAEASFARALVYRDSSNKIIDKRIITYIPDKSYLAKNPDPSTNNWLNSIDKKFSGYIEYRNWNNEVNMVIRIIAGKAVHVYNVSPAPNNNAAGGIKPQGLKTNDVTCITYRIPASATVTTVNGTYYADYTGERYCTICSSPSDDDNFTKNRPPMPPADWVPVYGQLGGGGTPSSNVSDADIANSTYVNDGKPTIDPLKYINCFTDGKQAKEYRMTLYVAQPTPGSNDQISFFSHRGETFKTSLGQLYNVGHAFVGFQKINTDGSSVTQVMGFYPNPQGVVSNGSIKDDSSHPFDVSYTITVSASQFQTALTGVVYDGGGHNYILSSYLGSGSEYNCVDAARYWIMSSGVALPQSTNRGSFLNSPGDYGQALRSFSGANSTSGNAPNSHGPCN